MASSRTVPKAVLRWIRVKSAKSATHMVSSSDQIPRAPSFPASFRVLKSWDGNRTNRTSSTDTS